MSEWKEYKLGDIAKFSYGRMPKKELLNNGIYPTFSGYKYQYTYPEYNCNEGDLIIVARGVGGTGDVKIIREKCYLTNLSLKVEFKEGTIFNDFFYYFFKQETLRYLDSGSAQSQITIQDLESESFLLPDFETQKLISNNLRCIDDKIDLLHRQNATLEKIAETLFRQWFVEEAKEDWESKPLSSIANFLNGLACQKFLPKSDIEKLPVLKIKELSSGITENSDWATTEVKPEYIVKNGDVIFAWSASLMVKIWDGQDCILNQHLFKVTSVVYPKWFYLFWCKHHLDEFITKAASHATTMGHIKRGDLDEAMVLIPSTKELEEMTLETEPLIEKIIANNKQIKLLVNLRDTLLPKLMSGEVTVEQ